MSRTRTRVVVMALLSGALAVSGGCRRGQQPQGSDTVKPSYNKDTGRLERITYDRNKDGKPDAWLFMDGTRAVLAELDENYDGVVDRREYYVEQPASTTPAPAGKTLPPRHLLTRAEQATRGDGKINRWETYQQGLLVHVEEDTNGDGRVDKWETWSQGVLQLVELDTKGTGRPNRRLVYPPDGSAPRLEVDEHDDGTFSPTTPTP